MAWRPTTRRAWGWWRWTKAQATTSACPPLCWSAWRFAWSWTARLTTSPGPSGAPKRCSTPALAWPAWSWGKRGWKRCALRRMRWALIPCARPCLRRGWPEPQLPWPPVPRWKKNISPWLRASCWRPAPPACPRRRRPKRRLRRPIHPNPSPVTPQSRPPDRMQRAPRSRLKVHRRLSHRTKKALPPTKSHQSPKSHSMPGAARSLANAFWKLRKPPFPQACWPR